MSSNEEISVKDLNSLNNYIIIDIRDEISFKYGSIKGAVSIPQRDLFNRLDELDRNKLIIVMCKSGIISDTVADELRGKGYNAVNLKEGYYGYMLKSFSENDKAKDVERSINKKFHKAIWSKFTAALKEYELLQENDKVAVCISGGKDSMLMAKLFQELKRHNKYPFYVVYLVMDPGYSPENREIIEKNAKLLDIPITIFETNIFESVLHIEKSPCYICARMRRGYLYSKAKELGCNKIALGHHMSDVIETVVMAMFNSSKLETMIPKVHSLNFEGMELIRPMYRIKEEDVLAWCRYNDLDFVRCACKFAESTAMRKQNGENSRRQETKDLIKELKKTNPGIEDSIFNAVHAVQLDTFPGYKTMGEKHSFTEHYSD